MYDFLIYSCLGIYLGILSSISNIDKYVLKISIIILVILCYFYFKYKNNFSIIRWSKNIFYILLFIIISAIYTHTSYLFGAENNNSYKEIQNNEKHSDIFIIKNIIPNDKYRTLSAENMKGENTLIYAFISKDFLGVGDVVNVEWKANNNIIYPDINNNNYKSFDILLFANSRGYINVISSKKITKTDFNDYSQFPELIWWDKIVIKINIISEKMRNYFRKNLQESLNNISSPIVMAMVWGDEGNISKEIKNKYNNAGISHILVLSGYNIALLFSFCFILFARLSFRLKLSLSFIMMIFFILLVFNNPPIIRAFIMFVYILFAQFFYRSGNSKLAIWLSLFVFAVFNPISLVYDVSLQLSTLATIAILYIYPEIKRFFTKNKSKDINILYDLFLLILSVNILLFPFLLYTFGQFNLLSIFINVIISPLIPIIMIFGIIISIFGSGLFFIAKIIAFIINYLIIFINSLTKYSIILEYRDINYFSLIVIYIIIFILYKILVFRNIMSKDESNI